ncbi:acetolactate synthase small subunit [Candidatus Sumerlaeota bacterium]|nr:acetolactate synthase small subunit [Candidatus Sumerlaeota bacterium]
MRHVISVLVENQFGVLTRIAGMFSSRGFNIDSLAVGETTDPTISRITVVSHGDDQVIEQIIKQLRKLVDVIRVQDLTGESHIERELVLIKVACNKGNRAEIMEIASIFRANIVDVSAGSLVIEAVGAERKIDAMLDLLKPFGVLETARTGSVGLSRGPNALKV